MFLIITADQRFWKTERPCIFLGEWCKIHSQKTIHEALGYEVLPYHWDDRGKSNRDYAYLQGLYERTLAEMSAWLNRMHGEQYPVQYWRIIIGPWLFYFIHIFFDRYECIAMAVRSGKVDHTMIVRPKMGDHVPLDYHDLTVESIFDPYNHFLFSWLIERMGTIPFEYVDEAPANIEKTFKPVRKKPSWKKFLRNAVEAYEKSLPHRFNSMVLMSCGFSGLDQAKLQISLGQFPSMFCPEIPVQKSIVDPTKRADFTLTTVGNEFELFLSLILPWQVPQAYVENYKDLKAAALAAFPQRPKVIATNNELYSNEAFKIWAAEKTQQGARFAVVQHGGFYGAALCCPSEEHEVNVSDRYYSWGWQADEGDRVRPLAASKLNRFSGKITPSKDGDILLVWALVPRYSYYLCSFFIGATGTMSYFNDQFMFARNLTDQARKFLSVRFYPVDYGWEQEARWASEFPEVPSDRGKKPMAERLKECRLFVSTYNGTCYLESLASDFPTILFWNPMNSQLRPSAQPYFDELKKVGILHDTPESAAQKVNEVWADPLAWWRREDVQLAKNNFCSRFAQTSDHWLQEWRAELLSLSREGAVR